MGSLLSGLGNLLKEDETTAVDVAVVTEPQCAMDLAMQAAIEKHTAAGGEPESTPSVKTVRRKSGGAFGRRGA